MRIITIIVIALVGTIGSKLLIKKLSKKSNKQFIGIDYYNQEHLKQRIIKETEIISN